MNSIQGSGSPSGVTRPHSNDPGGHFTAPLGSAASGRLVFTSNAEGLALLAAPALDGLARARFGERLFWIGFEAGILIVAYRPNVLRPPSPRPGRLPAPHPPGDEIALNASIPWEVEFRAAASRVTARLGGLQLRSLDLLGGASQIALELSKPDGAAYLYLAGGVRQVSLHRPAGVGVGITVQDGATHLALDGHWYRSLNRDTRLESLGFDPAYPNYEISLAGEVRQVTID